MTYVELADGTSSRRIKVPDLDEPIRIDVGGDAPRIEVAGRVTIERPRDGTADAGTDWEWDA